MPAQKRPYVSPETAAQLADLRRRMSATEGRTVTTDEVVSRMLAGSVYIAPCDHGQRRITVSIYIDEARFLGAADPEKEARRAMIEYLEDFE
ncbi:MAG: hypothetical protein WC489_09320 [Patescibacteria group bacterium]|jgi:hypothetical protein|nr:hypothetical protein [Dehalococcoidia bacterium]